MDLGGPYSLGDDSITAADSDLVITSGQSAAGATQAFIDRLVGANGFTLACQFIYVGGGTSVRIDIETALGSGGVWIPIARFDFTTASASKVLSVTRADRLAAYTVAALSADAAVTGIIGDRLRAKRTSVGTYSVGTQALVRAAVS